MADDRRLATNTVRAWMRAVLQDKGWTANEWATAAGTSPTNLTRLLSGEGNVPTVETVMKLARIARSSPNLVVGEANGDALPVTEHPHFCPQCGYDLDKATPRRKRKSA